MEEENFDPVKAEKYQDAMLKSREKMQRDLEIKAQEHQEKMEAVRPAILHIAKTGGVN